MHGLLIALLLRSAAPKPTPTPDPVLAVCGTHHTDEGQEQQRIEVLGTLTTKGLQALDAGTLGKPTGALARLRSATWYGIDAAQELPAMTFSTALLVSQRGEIVAGSIVKDSVRGNAADFPAMVILGPCEEPGAVYATTPIHPVERRKVGEGDTTAARNALLALLAAKERGSVGTAEAWTLLDGSPVTLMQALPNWGALLGTKGLAKQPSGLAGARLDSLLTVTAFRTDSGIRWVLGMSRYDTFKDRAKQDPIDSRSNAALFRIEPDSRAIRTDLDRTIWSE